MITTRERARLLETIGSFRGHRETRDSRIAAIVLLLLDGFRLRDVLAWRVDDVTEQADATHWAIKRAVKSRDMVHVLTVATRAALTIYLARRIGERSILKIDRSPFFDVTQRAVQAEWHKVRRRAKLEHVTFHDIKGAAAPRRRSSDDVVNAPQAAAAKRKRSRRAFSRQA